jgi:hypothetical protein
MSGVVMLCSPPVFVGSSSLSQAVIPPSRFLTFW